MTLAALASGALARPQLWQPVALAPTTAAPDAGNGPSSYTQRLVDSFFNRRKLQTGNKTLTPGKDYPMELNLMSDFLASSIPDLKIPTASSSSASSNDHQSLDKLILTHTKIKRPILKQTASGTVGFIKQPVKVEDVRWEHVDHDQLITANPRPPFPSAPSYSSFDHHRPSHGTQRPSHDHHKPQLDPHWPAGYKPPPSHDHNGPSYYPLKPHHDSHKPSLDASSFDHRPPYSSHKPQHDFNKPSHDSSSFDHNPEASPHQPHYHKPSHHYHKPVSEYTTLVHKPIATIQQIHHQTSTSFPQIIIVNHHYPTLVPTTLMPPTLTESPPADFAPEFAATTVEETTTTTEIPETTTRIRSTTTRRPPTTRPTPRPTTTTTEPTFEDSTTPYAHEILKCPEITINSLINNYNYNNSSKQAGCSDVNLVINNHNFAGSTTAVSTTSTSMDDADTIQEDPLDQEPEYANEYPDEPDIPPTLASTVTPIMNFMNGLNPLSYGFWSILLAPFALVIGLLSLFTHHTLWKRSYQKPVVNKYYRVKHEHPKEYQTIHYSAANEFVDEHEYEHRPGHRRDRREDGGDVGRMLREEMDILSQQVWRSVEKYLGWDESDGQFPES